MAQGTVLPTDITPTQANLQRRRPPNHFELRLLEKLPASFFVNANAETTFRIETNPYQFPLKRTLLHKEIPPGTQFSQFTKADQKDILEELNSVAKFDNVYRINPSITAGWSPTGATQYFVTYFLLRDSLMRHTSLNSTTQAIGIGAQHTWFVGKKTSIQPQITIRELYQSDEPNVLDYLPAITAQYMFSNNLVTYVNVLYQMRMRHFVGGPGREMNPFYTEGLQYNRGRWTFLASGTFLQNFRQPFGKEALIQQNNYSWVCDFEVDRQISEKLPGVQAIIRAEPVYNFHGKATPGLAGMDFRLYYGVRISAAKPAFPDTLKMLRQRYQRAAYTQQSSMSKPAAEIAEAEDPS
jgi:hypothetical protein